MKLAIVIISLTLLAWPCAASARAEQPVLLKEFDAYMVAHHYFAARLTSLEENQQAVEAVINGQKVTLHVDTGCDRTYLSYPCARRLGLDIHDAGTGYVGLISDIKDTYGIALIKSFQLHSIDLNRTNTVMVLPKNAVLNWGADGLLGDDILILNGAIFPVGGRSVLLKPGPAPPVSVADYMSKLNFKPVSLRAENHHIWVDAHLNGRTLKLIVDSGASFTNLRASSVKAALREKELDSSPWFTVGSLDGKWQSCFYFTPKRFDLGGFDVSHQTVLATTTAVFDRENFDGLLGFDLLGHHDGIIDFGRGVLWLR